MNPNHDNLQKTPFPYALAVQRDASALGFDWPDVSGVLDKLEEELAELREAVKQCDTPHAQRELGDVLFAAVSAARFLDIDPELCLAAATRRFEDRLAVVKTIAANKDIVLPSCTADRLDALWEQAKRLMRQQLEKCLDNDPAHDAD